MWRWMLAVALTALLTQAPTRAELAPGGAAAFFDTGFGDFQEELATARDQGKVGILLFFEEDDCPFCRRMKERVLNQVEVQDYYRAHFLIFSVNVEGDIEVVDFGGQPMAEKDFAFAHNKVRATPVFQFHNLEGEPVARYTGPTQGVDEFLLLGRYVVEEGYREMPFTRYKREVRRGGGGQL